MTMSSIPLTSQNKKIQNFHFIFYFKQFFTWKTKTTTIFFKTLLLFIYFFFGGDERAREDPAGTCQRREAPRRHWRVREPIVLLREAKRRRVRRGFQVAESVTLRRGGGGCPPPPSPTHPATSSTMCVTRLRAKTPRRIFFLLLLLPPPPPPRYTIHMTIHTPSARASE